jgi:hypothetical protein
MFEDNFIFVLANGSPTKEFEMGCRLRQGDPLLLFLFLMVAEGFHMLMRKSVEFSLFTSFKFDGVMKAILAYNTQIICWIKGMAEYSNYKGKIGSSPFKYLRLPIGANPRCLSTKQPVIDAVWLRLSNWKHNQLAISGRMVIIKSGLSALLVYFLSFLKAPSYIISKLE